MTTAPETHDEGPAAIDVLEQHSIIAWLVNNQIKNEKGEPIDFYDHPFLYDIYRDPADFLAVMKCAQAGLSTLEILRNHYDAKSRKMDIIYTLPTDEDVRTFVGGKVNRIIAANPCMAADTADKDSIEQKAIGQSMMYYRGTWTKKAAIMVTADRLVHDEKDSSKQDVIADYQARLQHSRYKQVHVFSHPSVRGGGVDVEWNQSDQKEWFIRCPSCKTEQHLTWSTTRHDRMSVDIAGRRYRCKKCDATITDDARRAGRWVQRFKSAKYSGYHINLMMCPWVNAGEIADKWADVMAFRQSEDWFYSKVLGLPFAGSGNVVERQTIIGSIRQGTNPEQGRMVIGVDTGVKLRWVAGNRGGIMGYGEMTDYIPDETNKLRLDQTLEWFLITHENSIMVIDQGGDIIGSRKLQSKYPGRVFLCHYARDRKTQQLVRWGEKDNAGTVLVDRNRAMQMVVDEFRDNRMNLWGGNEAQWHDYWLHWSHIYRVSEMNTLGVKEYEWHRSDRDDWVHATVYWRVGVTKYGDGGMIVGAGLTPEPNSYMLNPDGSASFDPEKMFELPPTYTGEPDEETEEWR